MFAFWVFALTFLFCEPGERVSNRFGMFGEELERCNWYELSMEMQRMYMIFLSDTQQTMNIQSYGGIQCTRDTSKRVIHAFFFQFGVLLFASNFLCVLLRFGISGDNQRLFILHGPSPNQLTNFIWHMEYIVLLSLRFL